MKMGNVAKLIEPKYLNGEMLGPIPQVVTVTGAHLEWFEKDGKDKAIVQFVEHEKPMSCNTTQTKIFAEFFGLETAAWVGNKVMVFGRKLTSGQFAGKWTIEVTAAPPQEPEQPQQTEAVQPEEQAVF